MNLTILGIDPGLSGGLAVLFPDGRSVAYKMPETERDLWDLLGEARGWGATHAMLELVRSSPQMGVTSSFTFGKGLGGLRMALIGHGFVFAEVTPGVWRKALKMPKNESSEIGGKGTEAKNNAKRRAQELFPGIKVTHANADALLIATYGRAHFAPAASVASIDAPKKEAPDAAP